MIPLDSRCRQVTYGFAPLYNEYHCTDLQLLSPNRLRCTLDSYQQGAVGPFRLVMTIANQAALSNDSVRSVSTAVCF